MANENGAWTRQGETFWRAHHEAWTRSDLNQRVKRKAFRSRRLATGDRCLKWSHSRPSGSCCIDDAP